MSLADPSERRPFTFTGKHMAAIMIAFFGTIIAVNLTMAVIATKSWTGLVVKNSFVASQEYNGVLADAAAQAERGWTSSLGYRNGILSVTLADKSGAPLSLETVAVDIGRPSFEQSDRTLVLEADGPGLYDLNERLAPGHWDMVIRAASGSDTYRRDLRLFIGSDGVGAIQ